MLPPLDAHETAIEQGEPVVTLTVEAPALLVDANDLLRVCRFVQQAPEMQMDHVSNLTAIDYPTEQRIDTVYHLYSMAKKHGPITLKVRLPRANPHVPSLVPVYRGAEFQEREAFDLYGVIFDGHPDLRRILLWEGFDGHPMRKDYVVEDQNVLDENR